MAKRGLMNNQVAAVLAFAAGILFLVVDWNGARIVEAFFELLVDLFGPNPAFRVLAIILISIASLGGAAVILGALLIGYNRVRGGKILVLLGTGAGIVSLVMFLVLLVRRSGGILAHEGAIPVLVGVVLSLAARLKAKPLK